MKLTRQHENGKNFGKMGDFTTGDKIILKCEKLTAWERFEPHALPVRLVRVVDPTTGKSARVPAIATDKANSRRSGNKATRVGPNGKRRTAGSQRVSFPQVYAECDGDKAEIMRRTGKNEAAYRQAVSRMNRRKQPDTDGNAA